jgi:NAD(P)-dependent dehydrogenase (short-subunit alcohol dehydrogenase family)
VVTGASSGIGLATAIELARTGCRVIPVCRDRSGADAAIDSIRRVAPSARVEAHTADLSLLAETARLARTLGSDDPELDGLIHCAGIFCSRRVVTAEGIELHFATNFLSGLSLARELQTPLRRSREARILFVSSSLHRLSRGRFEDLRFDHSLYHAVRAYARSKLALVIGAREFACQLAGSTVSVNCVDPGLVRTRIGRRPWVRPAAAAVFRQLDRFARPAESAGAEIAELATSPRYSGISGCYFHSGRATQASRVSRDPATERRLLDVVAELMARRSAHSPQRVASRSSAPAETPRIAS